MNTINKSNILLEAKYNITSRFYDILDYYWERQYRQWRPDLLKDIRGLVLEAGVGTGSNFKYYHSSVNLTGIDLCKGMLKKAKKKSKFAACQINLHHEDASIMKSIPSNHFDWLISTFLCCVMPENIQPLAIKQFERVLKPGGHFRLLEMVYSKNPKLRKRQDFFAPFVEKVYGARFDRNTLELIQKSKKLKVNTTYFLKDDVYLVIEGVCKK